MATRQSFAGSKEMIVLPKDKYERLISSKQDQHNNNSNDGNESEMSTTLEPNKTQRSTRDVDVIVPRQNKRRRNSIMNEKKHLHGIWLRY